MVMQKMAFKDAVMLKLKMDGAQWAAELIPILIAAEEDVRLPQAFGRWANQLTARLTVSIFGAKEEVMGLRDCGV